MKHLLLLSCLLAAPCFGQDSPEADLSDLPEYRVFGEAASAEDAEAITSVMQRLGQAWGSGDADAVAALYAEDAEWTNAFGNVIRSPAELRAFLASMFSQDAPGTSASELSSYRPLSLRYVGDNVAIVHGVVTSTREDARSGEGLRRVHNTYVLTNESGDWQIIHHIIMDARE